MTRYMTFRFDVSKLTERQREILAGSVIAQAEASDFSYETNQEWSDENYPDVKVVEICHFCGQVVESGECGGEGEGICTELACVTDFAPGKRGIEDSLMKCSTAHHESLKADPEKWAALKYIGIQITEADEDGPETSTELRDCPCGSTLGKVLER